MNNCHLIQNQPLLREICKEPPLISHDLMQEGKISILVRLSPPQRPPAVAPWEKYTRGARRLGRGKIKARGERFFPLPIVPHAPVFSLRPALPLPFLSLVFTEQEPLRRRELVRGKLSKVTFYRHHHKHMSRVSAVNTLFHICLRNDTKHSREAEKHPWD